VDVTAISLADVIKVYREADIETIALRGIDLTVADGEFVAIMGRSGSGKSTLLNLIAGSDRPTAGRVVVAGTDVARAAEAARGDLRGGTVGIVFQSQNLAAMLDLTENVLLAASLAGRPIGRTDALEALGRVGLADRAGHRPDRLSGGEQQRAALACVLAAGPRILLADEITGELDSVNAAQLLDLIRDVHRADAITVVLVTHDPAVAARAERVVELRDGRVVADRRTA
jgi:ABC-type lipoprotein export system ATPase subunit